MIHEYPGQSESSDYRLYCPVMKLVTLFEAQDLSVAQKFCLIVELY
jgi:hypothetical protein